MGRYGSAVQELRAVRNRAQERIGGHPARDRQASDDAVPAGRCCSGRMVGRSTRATAPSRR